MPTPNVIIYLTASLETLQKKRISLRGREFEKKIDPQYLLQLISDYETAMNQFAKKNHPSIPILKFNGDDMDFVNEEDDLNYILSALKITLKKEITKS
ncbi:hypothetical protein GCM10020331_019400 [Ectobacillus funiculus]